MFYFQRCIVSLCPRECVVLKNEEKDESSLNTSNLLPKASSRFSGIEATLTRANVDRTEATTDPMSDREFRGLFADGKCFDRELI